MTTRQAVTEFLLARYDEEGDTGLTRVDEDVQAKRELVATAPVTVLLALASYYSQHPDFQPEWRP